MEEEKLRAVYYARCSTEEENQKDALVRQAAEAEEAIRARGWRLGDAYVESRSGTSRNTFYFHLLFLLIRFFKQFPQLFILLLQIPD